jgi:Ca-activated chloride channel family protein
MRYEEALAAVRKADAVVYVVSKARAFIAILAKYPGGNVYIPQMERAEELMTRLAAHTGGRIFSPLEDKEMAGVYAQVAREMKNQYVITYTPKNKERDGRLRRISVYLTRPGYTARTRDGYYAPKE